MSLKSFALAVASFFKMFSRAVTSLFSKVPVESAPVVVHLSTQEGPHVTAQRSQGCATNATASTSDYSRKMQDLEAALQIAQMEPQRASNPSPSICEQSILPFPLPVVQAESPSTSSSQVQATLSPIFSPSQPHSLSQPLASRCPSLVINSRPSSSSTPSSTPPLTPRCSPEPAIHVVTTEPVLFGGLFSSYQRDQDDEFSGRNGVAEAELGVLAQRRGFKGLALTINNSSTTEASSAAPPSLAEQAASGYFIGHEGSPPSPSATPVTSSPPQLTRTRTRSKSKSKLPSFLSLLSPSAPATPPPSNLFLLSFGDDQTDPFATDGESCLPLAADHYKPVGATRRSRGDTVEVISNHPNLYDLASYDVDISRAEKRISRLSGLTQKQGIIQMTNVYDISIYAFHANSAVKSKSKLKPTSLSHTNATPRIPKRPLRLAHPRLGRDPEAEEVSKMVAMEEGRLGEGDSMYYEEGSKWDEEDFIGRYTDVSLIL
ncbi:hypothetical protein JAAARDRAFT_46672 [Jaapia argillacea MUCL 33604]|uniref:Uncharacterized protein n=1 Tax=Jaapia argillacea MUCL 33604 TaxID=933084 RepID=A0A067PWK6_9AGAM|nr:hypothetical protein JAAARDRAFT_46672 [Jaapia argillacea MUCL 33604]